MHIILRTCCAGVYLMEICRSAGWSARSRVWRSGRRRIKKPFSARTQENGKKIVSIYGMITGRVRLYTLNLCGSCGNVFHLLFLYQHDRCGDHSREPSKQGKESGEHDRSRLLVHDGCGRKDESQYPAANVHGSNLRVSVTVKIKTNLPFAGVTVNEKPDECILSPHPERNVRVGAHRIGKSHPCFL